MKNMILAKKILSDLMRQGVREYCVCPGSRNACFLTLLEKARKIKVYSFFDERSACFFALGRIKDTKKPVACCVTSGSAVSELISGSIEAYYSRLPLVLLSADRPFSYRKKACPQSIEQKDLFKDSSLISYDLEKYQKINISSEAPTHINVCFKEPIIDGNVPSLFVKEKKEKKKKIKRNSSYIKSFLKKSKRPLFIVSSLFHEDKKKIKKFLKDYSHIPSYIEAHSEIKNLFSSEIISGESFLNEKNFKKYFDSVIRFGSVPSIKLWRNLEKIKAPVLNVTESCFPGLSYLNSSSCVSLEEFLKKNLFFQKINKEFLKKDKKFNQIKNKLLKEHPLSEASLVNELSKYIPEKDSIFLGNSLPIREWDEFCRLKNYTSVFSNRGVNGINGLISTALGLKKEKMWCILGDLSMLYDLNSFWAFQYLKKKKFNLVVINNESGFIFEKNFSKIKHKKYLSLKHQTNFKEISQIFPLNYLLIQKQSDFRKLLKAKKSNLFIEIKSSNQESLSLDKKLKSKAFELISN